MNASSRRSSRLRQGLLAVAAMVLSTGLVACGSSNSSTSASSARVVRAGGKYKCDEQHKSSSQKGKCLSL